MANLSNINNKFLVTTGGDVGIGVTGPVAKLEVSADVAKGVLINRTYTTSSQSLANVRAYYGLAITPLRGGTGGLYFTNYDADTPIIQSVNTSDVAQFLLLNPLGGNVGIGTTSPTGYRLVVENTAEDLLKLYNSTDGLDSLISFSNPGGTLARIQGIDNGGLAFDTGNNAGGINSNAMFINNSGNVGIGTVSPSTKLEIFGNNSARNTLQNILSINGGTSSNNVYSGFGMGLNFNGRDYSNQPRDYAYIYGVQQASSTNTPGGDPGFTSQLTFYTNTGGAVNTLPTQKMVINALGNVGINVANPGFQAVDAYGQIGIEIKGAKESNQAPCLRLHETGSGKGSFELRSNRDATTSGNYFAIAEGTDTFFAIRGDDDGGGVVTRGYVGIGTTSPDYKLEVEGASGTAISIKTPWAGGAYGQLRFQTGTGNSSIRSNVPGNSTNGLDFYTYSGSETVKMTILGSGNVGIGTTSPAHKLSIEGGANTVIQMSHGSAAVHNWALAAQYITTNAFQIVPSTVVGGSVYTTPVATFKSTGNVGIGTVSPLGMLEVAENGGGTWTPTNKPTLFVSNAGTSNSYYALGIKSNSGDIFAVTNAGNVGIGTTTPSEKLDVAGNAKIQGTIIQEGTGANVTFRYRTTNSSTYSGGNALVTFGRFYWTPAHWANTPPVLEITLQCKYYQGEQRKYIIKAGYGNVDPIINELQPSSTQQKITLQVGATTSAGYNYAGQPVYYVDLQWTQTAYIWGWAQIESQVGFLTSNPTSTWGGVVMDSALTQTNNSGTPTNYTSFFAGNIKVPSTYNLTTGTAANMHVDSNGFFYRSTSSLKYKTDVRDYDKGLNEVMQLQPKYYKGKDDGNVQFAGLIAEDVHDLGLTEFVQYADDKTPDALAYPNMIALLTKAIQELKAEIEILKNK